MKFTRLFAFLAVCLLAYGVTAGCRSGDDKPSATATAALSPTTTASTTAAAGPSAEEIIQVAKSGYTQISQDTPGGRFISFTCGLILENKSQTQGASQVNWTVDFFDASNNKIGGTYGYMYSLLPGEKRGTGSCGGQINPVVDIARMVVSAHPCSTCLVAVKSQAYPTATVTGLDKSGGLVYKGQGTATNPFPVAIKNGFIYVVEYNAAGDILGSGSGAHFDAIDPGATYNWESQVYINPNDAASSTIIDHIEAYVEPDITNFQGVPK